MRVELRTRYELACKKFGLRRDEEQLKLVFKLEKLRNKLKLHRRAVDEYTQKLQAWNQLVQTQKEKVRAEKMQKKDWAFAARVRRLMGDAISSVTCSNSTGQKLDQTETPQHVDVSELSDEELRHPFWSQGIGAKATAQERSLREKQGRTVHGGSDDAEAELPPPPIRPAPPRGLFIHGGVGRGKTFCMDLFAAAVAGDLRAENTNKATHIRRVHHNGFMSECHQRLNAHSIASSSSEHREADFLGNGEAWAISKLVSRLVSEAPAPKRSANMADALYEV